MRFQIEQRDLLAGIQRVIGVVEKRTTLPILSYIVITAHPPSLDEDVGISIFATDLEIGIRDSYPADVLVPGQITYPARKLLDIARTLPEGKVDIEEQENGWVSIKSGNAVFKVAALPPDQFPKFPPSDEDESDTHEVRATVSAENLARLIRKTVFAAGENDMRYILNGILVQVRRITGEKSMIRLVATDGHRLAISEDTFQVDHEGVEEENLIVPKKGMLEIKRLLDDIMAKSPDDPKTQLTMILKKGTLTVTHERGVLISRLLHGNYPKYQQVIPQECDRKVEVNRASLMGGIARVSTLSEERMSVVDVCIQTGQIVLSSRTPEFGEAVETIPTAYCGETLSLRFISQNLRELLSVIEDDDIVIEFKSDRSSCMIKEKSGRSIFVFVPSAD